MSKSVIKWPSILSRMFRASRLDIAFFQEIKNNQAAGWQAPAVVALTGLATVTSIGWGGFFKMAGALSPLALLTGILISLLLWLGWSLGAWLIGTKVFRRKRPAATFRELLRTTGFAVSPGILGILVFIPLAGGTILLAVTLWVIIALVVALKAVLDVSPGKAIVTWAIGCVTVGLVLIVTIAVSVFSVRFLNSNVNGSFDSRLNTIVQPYRFSLASWELVNAPAKIAKMMSGGGTNMDNAGLTVEKYFSTGERTQSEQDAVERILEYQIRQTLAGEDITGFPPVNLQLSTLPRLLVISPRDRIESIREIFLDARLSPQQIEDIERRADSLNVSSLVVELGGFGGTFPTMVANNSDLRFTVDAAVEEWLHQYLVFKPLGFRYVMDLTGIQRNYEIATINEAVAGMVSQEIGAALRRQYYREQNATVAADYSAFYQEMREIRLAVDDYLAKGEITAAEQFMEQKRKELAAKGYYIRKLNQAYFAWHGTYANQPGSVSPIGEQLRELRTKYGSVGQFLAVVSEMTSERDLKNRLATLQ